MKLYAICIPCFARPQFLKLMLESLHNNLEKVRDARVDIFFTQNAISPEENVSLEDHNEVKELISIFSATHPERSVTHFGRVDHVSVYENISGLEWGLLHMYDFVIQWEEDLVAHPYGLKMMFKLLDRYEGNNKIYQVQLAGFHSATTESIASDYARLVYCSNGSMLNGKWRSKLALYDKTRWLKDMQLAYYNGGRGHLDVEHGRSHDERDIIQMRRTQTYSVSPYITRSIHIGYEGLRRSDGSFKDQASHLTVVYNDGVVNYDKNNPLYVLDDGIEDEFLTFEPRWMTYKTPGHYSNQPEGEILGETNN